MRGDHVVLLQLLAVRELYCTVVVIFMQLTVSDVSCACFKERGSFVEKCKMCVCVYVQGSLMVGLWMSGWRLQLPRRTSQSPTSGAFYM